jgi:antitoxin component of MazEF toxin-antitoxin module
MKNKIIEFQEFEKKESLKSLLNKITPDNLHFEQEWGEIQGKEIF